MLEPNLKQILTSEKNHRIYNFGRVFFPGKADLLPKEIRFQPLGNHVGNVRQLVKLWNADDFPYECSLRRLIASVNAHDMGKPQRFEIRSKDKFKGYEYSFKGHRFLAKCKDKWTEKLARGHHSFSTKDICQDTYELKKNSDYEKLLDLDRLGYARELYILEMCDQIEAELACRVLDDDKQAESRAFMDFTISPDDLNSNIFYVDPWAFVSQIKEILLTFKYWSMFPTAEELLPLQKCIDENREENLGKTLDKIVKTWWNLGQEGKLQEKTIVLQPHPSSIVQHFWDAGNFYNEIAGWQPNPMQEEMFNRLYDPQQEKHPAILLKGATSTGKTEAIIFPVLASGNRLIISLPSRSLLEDQKQRIEGYLQKFSALYPRRELSLVVDTGTQMSRILYQDGKILPKRVSNPRRHLYKGDIILTTLDKFLYRYFGFGDHQKSFIFPLRINQDRSLICFDEAHTYDDISFTNFQGLVKSLYEAGRSIVLMTATLSPQHHDTFDYLELVDYINDLQKSQAIENYQKSLPDRHYLNQHNFEWIREVDRDSDNPEPFQDIFADTIVREWKKSDKNQIIVTVERVNDAAAIYKKLKPLLNMEAETLFLYHGRIAEQIRPELYAKIAERDRSRLPYILVTTSAIEVGCDLNSKVLISEICPPENLIQRVGRCNRKGNIANAKVIIIGNKIPDFANSLNEAAWETYQTVLESMSDLDRQAIAECINVSARVDDPRIVELFSMLEEYVYGADLTCQPSHERGLIPTRSWTPSVELRYKFPDNTFHSVSIPINRFYQKDGTNYAHTTVMERKYDKETTKFKDEDLTWGSAYSKQIIVEIAPALDDFLFGSDESEYSYLDELGFLDIPQVFSSKWVQDAEVKLKYDKNNHVVIISYIKSIE